MSLLLKLYCNSESRRKARCIHRYIAQKGLFERFASIHGILYSHAFSLIFGHSKKFSSAQKCPFSLIASHFPFETAIGDRLLKFYGDHLLKFYVPFFSIFVMVGSVRPQYLTYTLLAIILQH